MSNPPWLRKTDPRCGSKQGSDLLAQPRTLRHPQLSRTPRLSRDPMELQYAVVRLLAFGIASLPTRVWAQRLGWPETLVGGAAPCRKEGQLPGQKPAKPVRDAFPSVALVSICVCLYTRSCTLAEHPRGDVTAPRRYLLCSN